ncbi:reverse transcriptase [compost metagenome]
MTELRLDYTTIAPTLDYISDEVVLIQAWKKTQKYIRAHNWYADELEIDCSTINLNKNIKQWSQNLKSKTYQPKKIRVVPAPKNGRWVFRENRESGSEQPHQAFSAWGPEEEIKLRPLAHLSIDDQTVATAVLLCLAEAVETAQGPSDEEDFFKAQKNLIYSYGNRLHCEWNESYELRKQAKFNWGNSQLYRKYYEDYRLFLKRSKKICQYNSPKLLPNQYLFIVSVDLKGFFDHIDRKALINQLKEIYYEYIREYKLSATHNTEDSFWEVLKDIFNWKWEETEQQIELFDTPLPMGLPQGMVASGFLSNAYLIGFDKSIGEYIDKIIFNGSNQNLENIAENRKIILRDYCRYVDDLRLVIEASNITDTESVLIAGCVTDFISSNLKKHMEKISAKNELIINPDKTKVTSFRQTSMESNVSSMMSLFQGVFSGTPDVESLKEVVGGLDGLLHFSEDLMKEDEKRTNHLELSYISKPNIDVRDDTLKRFAGVRIANSLKMRRGMTDLSDSVNNDDFFESITEGEIIDHEFETSARKLIACWATNPSLTLLLKCGLDLFPDKILLNSVLEALDYILFPNEQPVTPQNVNIKQVKVIEYVTADLFRRGAVDIGYKSELEYPSSANISSFRQELSSFAMKVIDERTESPWYLKQQALLFLASVGDTINYDEKKRELDNYEYLHKLSSYQSILIKDIKKWFPIALVVQQLHPDRDKFAHWFVRLMNKTNNTELQKELIHLVVLHKAELLENICDLRLAKNKQWINYIPDYIQKTSQRDYDLPDNEEMSLMRVIQNYNNPFTQENALLLLIYQLLNTKNVEEKLAQNKSLKSIRISSKNWNKIQSLKDDLLTVVSIESNNNEDIIDGLYELPPWVIGKKVWLYKLGSILRSCLTSEFDFTTSTFLYREEEPGRYSGLRSTWYSRRFGLANSPNGLSKNQDPITPWISELLFLLLQWPGIHVHEEFIHKFEEINTPGDLLNIIVKRIEHQKRLYGKITDTPVYELRNVCYNKSDDSTFRVVMVQTLLPKTKDFIVQDPTHWTSSLRAKHKAHLASVCRLIRLKLKAWAIAQNSENENMVDLIIFPELSVHPDDIWLLRRLSDSTKASIFAGMTFIKHELRDVPINQALWILRSQKHSGRNFVEVRQGKHHMTTMENKMGITGYRPYQVLVEFKKSQDVSIRVAGTICYDATDLALVADLRDISDMFVVTALNKDINTFDNMVNALHYHMYQPVILANTGEFGGSTAQAPFTKHDRLIAHVHGQNQIAISVFELDPTVFKSNTLPDKPVDIKTAPAGYPGRQ